MGTLKFEEYCLCLRWFIKLTKNKHSFRLLFAHLHTKTISPSYITVSMSQYMLKPFVSCSLSSIPGFPLIHLISPDLCEVYCLLSIGMELNVTEVGYLASVRAEICTWFSKRHLFPKICWLSTRSLNPH